MNEEKDILTVEVYDSVDDLLDPDGCCTKKIEGTLNEICIELQGMRPQSAGESVTPFTSRSRKGGATMRLRGLRPTRLGGFSHE